MRCSRRRPRPAPGLWLGPYPGHPRAPRPRGDRRGRSRSERRRSLPLPVLVGRRREPAVRRRHHRRRLQRVRLRARRAADGGHGRARARGVLWRERRRAHAKQVVVQVADGRGDTHRLSSDGRGAPAPRCARRRRFLSDRTRYRLNSTSALRRLATAHGFDVDDLTLVNNGPTWFRRIPGLFEAGRVYHRILDFKGLAGLRCGILLTLHRRDAQGGAADASAVRPRVRWSSAVRRVVQTGWRPGTTCSCAPSAATNTGARATSSTPSRPNAPLSAVS